MRKKEEKIDPISEKKIEETEFKYTRSGTLNFTKKSIFLKHPILLGKLAPGGIQTHIYQIPGNHLNC